MSLGTDYEPKAWKHEDHRYGLWAGRVSRTTLPARRGRGCGVTDRLGGESP